MSDRVIDTNVLLVASAAHPSSPFGDSHVPVEQRQEVFEWLAAFREDGAERAVFDEDFRIYDEYRHKLTDQDYGLQVIHQKMQAFSLRSVVVAYDANGHAEVPERFQRFDPSDRKFLAAALSDPSAIGVVNASDTDWLEIEDELAAAGVRVEHLLDAWLRASIETP